MIEIASHSSCGHQPGEVRIASRQECLVIHGRQYCSAGIGFRVIILDHQRFDRCKRQRLLHQRHEFSINDHDLRHRVIQLKRDDRSIQPGIDRMQNSTAHRHTVVAFQHGGRIRKQRRHRIPAPHPDLPSAEANCRERA